MGRDTVLEVVIAIFSVLAFAYVLSEDLSWIPSITGPRAETKPYKTHGEYWEFYLSQHSNEQNRALHIMGTGIAFMVLFVWGIQSIHKTIAWVCLSLTTGLIVHQLTIGEENGRIEAASVVVAMMVFTKLMDVPAWTPFVALVPAYAFAWVGHFRFEHNIPATFIYPTHSVISDQRLAFEMLTGNLPYSFNFV